MPLSRGDARLRARVAVKRREDSACSAVRCCMQSSSVIRTTASNAAWVAREMPGRSSGRGIVAPRSCDTRRTLRIQAYGPTTRPWPLSVGIRLPGEERENDPSRPVKNFWTSDGDSLITADRRADSLSARTGHHGRNRQRLSLGVFQTEPAVFGLPSRGKALRIALSEEHSQVEDADLFADRLGGAVGLPEHMGNARPTRIGIGPWGHAGRLAQTGARKNRLEVSRDTNGGTAALCRVR